MAFEIIFAKAYEEIDIFDHVTKYHLLGIFIRNAFILRNIFCLSQTLHFLFLSHVLLLLDVGDINDLILKIKWIKASILPEVRRCSVTLKCLRNVSIKVWKVTLSPRFLLHVT